RAARIATCALPVKTRSTPRPRCPRPQAQTSDAVLSGRVNAVLAFRPSPRWQTLAGEYGKKVPDGCPIQINKCLRGNRFNEFSACRMRPLKRAHSHGRLGG